MPCASTKMYWENTHLKKHSFRMYVIKPLYNQVEARSDSELTVYARTLETDNI